MCVGVMAGRRGRTHVRFHSSLYAVLLLFEPVVVSAYYGCQLRTGVDYAQPGADAISEPAVGGHHVLLKSDTIPSCTLAARYCL